MKEYKQVLNNFGKSSYIDYLNNSQTELHNDLIELALKYVKEKFGNKYVDVIKSDIVNITHHDTLEKWNVTNLARKYSFDGFDAFVAFVTPLDVSANSISNEKMTILKNNFNISDRSYVYFDYYDNGRYRVKNEFPICINDDKTPFILNMRRYDDCCNQTAYHRIFKLVVNAIKTNKVNNNFIQWKEITKSIKCDKAKLKGDLDLAIFENNKIVLDNIALKKLKMNFFTKQLNLVLIIEITMIQN